MYRIELDVAPRIFQTPGQLFLAQKKIKRKHGAFLLHSSMHAKALKNKGLLADDMDIKQETRCTCNILATNDCRVVGEVTFIALLEQGVSIPLKYRIFS